MTVIKCDLVEDESTITKKDLSGLKKLTTKLWKKDLFFRLLRIMQAQR